MLVEDQTAVITGAGSGIGRATASLYAEHGANVVVADIDEEGGQETVERIHETGGDATFVRTDVSNSEDVQEMIGVALSEYNALDVLFNNAGIEGPVADVAEYPEAEFERVLGVNLTGVFLGLKYGVDAMLADGGGSIINTSSIASETGLMGRSGYAATKAGVNGMTRVAAVEYAQDNIRVNSILPGVVETPMHDRAVDGREDGVSESGIAEAMPGNSQPEDIAAGALFLGSDMSRRITGVCLPVDGGFLQRP